MTRTKISTQHQGSSSRGRSLISIGLSILALACTPRQHVVAGGLLAVAPFANLLIHGMKCEALDGLILAALWSAYLLVLFCPLVLIVGRFVVLVVYAPLFIIFVKKPHQAPGPVFLLLETLLWDWPLILWVRLLCAVNRRGLRPFYSEVDSFVSIGSMPVGRPDAHFLAGKGVGAVVNMCREWRGPQHEYQAEGIVQHWAPTADVCEPSFIALLRAVRFMADYRLAHGKRCFVHCKAGRARSSAVVFCYLVAAGDSEEAAWAKLQTARPIVEESTRRQRVVRLFLEKLKGAGGKLANMKESDGERSKSRSPESSVDSPLHQKDQ